MLAPAQLEPGPPTTLLTMETITPYLLQHGFLPATSVVDATDALYQVFDYSRRNRVFKVVPPSGPGYLVKQAMDPRNPDFATGLLVEAQLLEAVAKDPALKDLRWFSPGYVHHDPESAIIITELIHPATTIARDNLNLGEISFQEDSAITCGRILANFHRLGTDAIADGLLPFLPKGIPTIWGVEAQLDEMAGATPAYREFRRYLRHESTFWRTIPEARARWNEHSGLVHRDPRWDNFLLTHGSAPGNNLNIRLIDWELASVGDPAWDVGYYLAEHIRFWLINGPRTACSPNLEDVVEKSRFKIEQAQPAARAFWDAYCRRQRLEARGQRALLDRVRALLPFHLALHALEALPHDQRIGWVAPVALHLAQKAHEDPDAILGGWLGVGA